MNMHDLHVQRIVLLAVFPGGLFLLSRRIGYGLVIGVSDETRMYTRKLSSKTNQEMWNI
jgi:hypothetical protein